MATVTATITVDFIANYTGPHRICFRIQGSGDPYDCSSSVNCVGAATACQAIIQTPVNTTSCDGTVTFEGYIQAQCEDVLSTNGRLPWTADFVPNVICEKHEILCARGGIQAVTPNPGGQEYIVADALTIVRNGADPETLDGTISIATVGTGVINSVTGITAAGTLYTVLDVLTVTDAFGAGATIRVDTIGGGGEILTFTLLTNGAGYIGPFTFPGGTGSGAVFDIQAGGVDYDAFGIILTVTISVQGLYSIAPTVTITTGTGSGATLDVTLDPCPIYTNVGLDCVGGDQIDIAAGALDVGETFGTCIEGGLVAATPSEYDVSQTGCCIPEDTTGTPCTDHHIENTSGGNIDVHITNCDGDDETFSAPPGISALCLVSNGYIDPDDPDIVITDQGTPCT